MIILYVLAIIALCTFLYWVGGMVWAHTLFRDLGCTLCIAGLAWLLFGWTPWILGVLICWGGFAIGDHEEWYWTKHAFVISLGIFPLAISMGAFWQVGLALAVIVAGTYIVSRFMAEGGWDVWLRGLLYATLPLWLLLG